MRLYNEQNLLIWLNNAQSIYYCRLQRRRKDYCELCFIAAIISLPGVVNADIIAAELSPLNPEIVALESGRRMLQRINDLLEAGVDFAFETTLATRSYVSFVKKAKEKAYTITLLYLWLPSPESAIQRVAERVENGGHNIPSDVIVRRYYRGIENLLILYIPICDNWYVVENTSEKPKAIAQGFFDITKVVFNEDYWQIILKQNEH